MVDLKAFLLKLNHNLNVLRERAVDGQPALTINFQITSINSERIETIIMPKP